MSKIDELIQQYCPDGVEYKKIGNLATFRRGSFPQPYGRSEWYDGEGAMPFVQVADIADNMKLVANTKRKISLVAQPLSVFAPQGSIIISLQGSIGRIAVTQYDAYIDRTVAIFYNLQPIIEKKYFVYQLQRIFDIKEKTARGSTIKTITKEEFTEFEIPVPPMEVQREIVHILDSFTFYTSELSAELSARREQFQCYLDKLLSVDKQKKKELVKISDLGVMTRGKRFVKADAVEKGVPCIHYGELYTHYGVWAKETKSQIRNEIASGLRFAAKNDVVIVGAGENDWDIGVGVAWLGDYGVAIHDACYYLRHNQNPKYISYCLRTTSYHQQIKKYVSTGKICAISSEGIGKAIIYLPSIEEQNRIVELLDRFYVIINDITEGLPAEIDARQKQYEYYRDKLLHFKRIN